MAAGIENSPSRNSLPERVVTGALDVAGQAATAPPSLLGLLRADARELWAARHVVRMLATSQLKALYQRSVLGFLWSLLTPLLTFAVMAFVFTHILGRTTQNFPLYLITGHVAWMFFSSSAQSGSKCLLSNSRILRKFPIHRMVFPLTAVGVAGINLVLVTVALMPLYLILGMVVGPQLLVLPVAMVLLAGFTLGLILITMTLVTFFRDFEHIIPVALRAGFFATPILLRPEQLGPYRLIMDLNPLTAHVGLFRSALYSATWPTGATWAVAVGSTIVSLALGYLIFKRREHEYVVRL